MYIRNLEVVIKKINEQRYLIYAKDFDLCFSGISEDDVVKNLLTGIELYAKESVDKNDTLGKLLFPGTDSFNFDIMEKASVRTSWIPLNRVFSNILTIKYIVIHRGE